jgi:hypothetical protein
MSMKIYWINNKKARFTNDDENNIYISIYKYCKGGKNERIRFRFSVGVHAFCFENADRILVGMSGNRIYFKPTESRDGYKIAAPVRNSQIRNFWVIDPVLAGFIHEHPTLMASTMEYDDKQNLFYIEAA